MKRCLLINLFLLTLGFGSCQEQDEAHKSVYETDAFKRYWYAGKAEVNSYVLDQSRYGEQRAGKAVLIFVTEDFSKKKQVKLDDPSGAGSDKANVLKLNFVKKFTTGIYPYSMMQSVFTPVNRKEYPHTLKTSMSSQEWCGHVFTQLNLTGHDFKVKSFSYFEKESDTELSIPNVLLEDEIWNIIRLEPGALPTGDIEILPGLFFTRLNHIGIKPDRAIASKEETGDRIKYTVSIPGQHRMLTIEFEKIFPYKILGWQEDFQERGKAQHTKATLDKTLITDYWTKNKNEFSFLRDSLNLSAPAGKE